ncbi:MAG: ATP-binding protein [Deltaproteobacteria bacterium]|nr:ATP-binding protein [Deltaproteobacteria bacterium]
MFRKTLRDLSKNYEREINFEVIGGELQVDIALMDRLREPFIHILRNAIAHGIEPPEEREASGKAREGKIVLEAERSGDSLVLKITDDGRGMNGAAITEYLKQKRSMSDEDISRMSEEAFYSTILNLDFSSAGRTDEMAGRGVGMNVVVQAIEYLNGSMSIRSRASQGTQFVIKLPLSLSLVYAVTFRLDRFTLSIPTTHVEGIKGVATTAGEEMDAPDRLRKLLRIEGNRGRASHVIELKYPGSLEAPKETLQFAVDAIMGNRPLMVMPVGELLAKTQLFAGVGIMENGEISVLLDTEKMLPRLTQLDEK